MYLLIRFLKSRKWKKAKKQAVVVLKQNKDIHFYADAKKTQPLTAENVINPGNRTEFFMLVDLKEAKENQLGLHLKFDPSAIKDGSMKANVLLEPQTVI
jgi:hypothetical protein